MIMKLLKWFFHICYSEHPEKNGLNLFHCLLSSYSGSYEFIKALLLNKSRSFSPAGFIRKFVHYTESRILFYCLTNTLHGLNHFSLGCLTPQRQPHLGINQQHGLPVRQYFITVKLNKIHTTRIGIIIPERGNNLFADCNIRNRTSRSGLIGRCRRIAGTGRF